jgi:hypothetical protein
MLRFLTRLFLLFFFGFFLVFLFLFFFQSHFVIQVVEVPSDANGRVQLAALEALLVAHKSRSVRGPIVCEASTKRFISFIFYCCSMTIFSPFFSLSQKLMIWCLSLFFPLSLDAGSHWQLLGCVQCDGHDGGCGRRDGPAAPTRRACVLGLCSRCATRPHRHESN